MKAFTIDADLNIRFYETKAEAAKVVESGEAAIFMTKDQLAEVTKPMGLPGLVTAYNGFVDVSVVRGFAFPSRKVAINSIWEECLKLAKGITREADDVGTSAAQDIAVPAASKPANGRTKRTPKSAKSSRKAKVAMAAATGNKGPRPGSKTAKVIAMLKRDGGASLADIMKKFGWQAHTTRAIMSAGGTLAKKHGITVVSTKSESGDRVYSIPA